MKKIMLSTLVAAGLMAASAAATAQQAGGIYAGVSIGQSKFKEACSGSGGTGVSCEDTDTAWRIFGGYEVNRNFAVELGYADLGQAKATATSGGFTATATAEATAWDLVAVGSWPISPNFSVYGKLGLFYGKVEGTAGGTGFGSSSQSDSGTDLTYGLGARFDFTRNLGARAEWQRYNDVSGSDIDVMSIGVVYRFR